MKTAEEKLKKYVRDAMIEKHGERFLKLPEEMQDRLVNAYLINTLDKLKHK